MKTFAYHEIVRVTPSRRENRKPFYGRVYSEYRDRPRGERRICVETPHGSGVAWYVRFVHKVSPALQKKYAARFPKEKKNPYSSTF